MSENANLLRQASRESLITFNERILPLLISDYVHFPYSDLISAKIEDLVAPLKSGRLAINVPPRHGKSCSLAQPPRPVNHNSSSAIRTRTCRFTISPATCRRNSRLRQHAPN